MRPCKKCGTLKPISQRCRPCHDAGHARWVALNIGKTKDCVTCSRLRPVVGHCKPCRAAEVKAQRAAMSPEAKEERRLGINARNATPEGKARKRASAARNRARHGAYIQAHKKQYKAANAATVKAYHKAYQKAHRSQYALHGHNRRSREIGSGGFITNDEWSAIVRAQRGRCAFWNRTDLPWTCPIGDRRIPLTRDHKIPVSRGGCGLAFNIHGLCGICNSTKHARLLTVEVSLFDRLALSA